MENLNEIFHRTEIENRIKEWLLTFDERSHELSFKKGIYIYLSLIHI